MFKRLKDRKLRKRIQKDGVLTECNYMAFVNNLDPQSFPSRSELYEYLKKYREFNDIFKLQIFRIETYSL